MIIRSRVGTARENEKWFRDNLGELHIVPPKTTRYPIYRIEFYLNGASFSVDLPVISYALFWRPASN